MIHTLNVDTPLKAVDAGNLALTALLAAPHNGDLVVLADGNGADLSRIVLESCVVSCSCVVSNPSDIGIAACLPPSRLHGVQEPSPYGGREAAMIDTQLEGSPNRSGVDPRTLYFSRSSFDKGADMITRRTLEGAWKWLFRDLRREDARPK